MRHLSRRQFLASSSTAVAAAALAPRSFASPNETLRIAVTGVRGRGLQHVEGLLAQKNLEIAAICDVNSNIIDKAMKLIEAKQGKKPAFHQDFRKLIEDKSLDAVSIATSNHTHAMLAIWALQAGKHVYVEKPVSHTIWEGRKLVEAVRKYGKICQTGTQSRSYPGFQEAIRFLQEGKLGKVKVARALCYNPRPSIGHTEDEAVPAGIDYNLWLGPAPERPFNKTRFFYNWHWFWDYGNGDLGNQGVHQIDILRWGLGRKDLPTKVLSVGGRFGVQDDGETPNSMVVSWEWPEGPQMIFELRGLETQPYKDVKVGCVFHCTEGLLTFNRAEAVAISKSGDVIQKFTGTGDHFANFLGAIRSNKPGDLTADIEQGHLSAAYCHLGNISYRLGGLYAMYKVRPWVENEDAADTFDRFKDHMTANDVQPEQTQVTVGKALSVDPKAERFVDDPEADKLLTKEYRKPFVVPDKV
ncbi:MAG: Gfo/Idh/MocA family oxidoreductase [Planctomycetaceae bacterium]|nr:Gfo/Idh/MocA family oxidoreductase [Planctomycetaceae bacterium]